MEQIGSIKQIKRYIEFVVLTALVLAYGLITYQRNFVWKDDISLWSDNVEKSPNKARPHYNLGVVYDEKGQVDNAILQYKKSLSLNPLHAKAHNNVGICYFNKGLVDKAITHFKYAVEIDPSHADAHYNLGIAYGEKGLIDLANEEIRKGIELRKR